MKTLIPVLLCLGVWHGIASGSSYTNNPSEPSCNVIAGPFTNAANGRFYYLLSATTWSNSEARAVSYGGHLATIRDADENQWIVDTFANYGGMDRPLWIGLTDRDTEGTFSWVSGEPVTYTKWNTNSGEPNNSAGSGYEEDFSYIIQRHSGNPTVLATYWNDVPSDGYGVIPPIFGVMETTTLIVPPPPVVPPPTAQVRFGCIEVCFFSQSNAQYQVQFKAYADTNWFNLGPLLPGTGGDLCVPDSPNGSNRVYRISVVP